jgi:hypothetical protein
VLRDVLRWTEGSLVGGFGVEPPAPTMDMLAAAAASAAAEGSEGAEGAAGTSAAGVALGDVEGPGLLNGFLSKVAYALFLLGGARPSPSPSGGLEPLAPMPSEGRAAAPEAVCWGRRRRARRSMAAGADHSVLNCHQWPVTRLGAGAFQHVDEKNPFQRRIETGGRRPPLSTSG